ncbi:MAG: formylglycine-generating enzyme family protein [Anaerolineae bacterium]|nr:formylglycine-generating enzyme family protein [Anaerolineae bacterium]
MKPARCVLLILLFTTSIAGLFLSGCGSEQDPAPSQVSIPTSTVSTLSPMSISTSTVNDQARRLAETGVTHNSDWTPYTEEINGVEMALVPAGCFMMGSTVEQLKEVFQACKDNPEAEECDQAWFENEQPAHQVCFDKPFWIDVTEVTNSQFEAFGGQAAMPSSWPDRDHPRENVTWIEASAFCQTRGARLLTEAEWEYAARGPDAFVYPWGDAVIAGNVVYSQNSGSRAWDVGSKPGSVSWVGALDLSGNVWEWVTDWYGEYSPGQQVNPAGPDSSSYRVLKGGAWNRSIERIRAANRGRADPTSRHPSYGFRCGGDASLSPTQATTSSPLPGNRADALALARAGAARNADWTPYTETIDGVEMALVPVGCFMIGSNDGESDEKPVRQVCFGEPFWVDIYEVTNAHYGSFGHWPGDNLPRESVTWTQADVFCRQRGLRLLTEAEWEYAARGPDGLVYPWSNEFIADNVVYLGSSDYRTWDVDSKPRGVSWIGAFNLSGNVWEWVNDWYGAYPSVREINPTGPDSGSSRVLRGGSWYGSEDYVRAAVRYQGQPDTESSNLIGFRCGGITLP